MPPGIVKHTSMQEVEEPFGKVIGLNPRLIRMEAVVQDRDIGRVQPGTVVEQIVQNNLAIFRRFVPSITNELVVHVVDDGGTAVEEVEAKPAHTQRCQLCQRTPWHLVLSCHEGSRTTN